jgi:threonylcarbamoyladenosine tRNA methylthiotransferase MtaB
LKKVSFYTLGCKVNAYDSSFMQELFLKNGYTVVDFGEPADITVINTCTVTSVADKKSRAAIRRAARTGKVIVTGCMSQKNPEVILSMEEAGAVIGTDSRADIVSVAERLLSGEKKIDLTHALKGCGYEDMSISVPGERTRGIIKIQEGCNNFCSYCIIPYVRGVPRSRNFESLISEAETLAKGGAKEIVLTGIHIASYSCKGRFLSDVLEALDRIDGIRIRIGSVEPGILGEEFIKRAASLEKLCPHFHLSLQSGSESVLKRMNRKYTPEEYIRFISLLRKYFDAPAITTDIIAGFPGETDSEHEDTKAFINESEFSRVHIFPFSAREGTKAYDMTPKVPKKIIKERAAELIALGEIYENRYIEMLIGKSAEIIFEDESDVFEDCLEGYSERYIRVASKADNNEIKTVKLIKALNKVAYGE